MQANVLIDKNGNPRIVDFGLAVIARDTNSLDSTSDERGLTARYSSPEILMETGRHSREADVFAFGMVMIEVRVTNLFRLNNLIRWYRFSPIKFRSPTQFPPQR